MNNDEFMDEMLMDYDEQVEYLLNKYGGAKYDYFHNETCKSINQKVKRTKEGLFCHHIDENIYEDISNPMIAKDRPFSIQKADRLVYCNYLEHLLLHMKIGRIRFTNLFGEGEIPSQVPWPALAFVTPGLVFICSNLNELYDQNGSSTPWRMRCYQEVEDNFEDYIFALNQFIIFTKGACEDEESETFLESVLLLKRRLSSNWQGETVEKIERKLKE